MLRGPLASLRFRLLLLVVMCMTPALVLMLRTYAAQRRDSRDSAVNATVRTARLVAASEDQFVESTRELLVVLSRLDVVRRGPAEHCGALLASLLREYRHHANLGVILAPSGELECSALPAAGPVNLGDREYFQRTLETKAFSVGAWQRGRITNRETINFGFPVLAEDGHVERVVYAALNLDWLRELAVRAPWQPGTDLVVFDRHGTVLVCQPDPDRWRGKPVPAGLRNRATSAQEERGVELEGLDGTSRLYTIVPLAGADNQIHVAVGMSRDVAFQATNAMLRGHLLSLGFVAILALAAAWIGADIFVLRRVKGLLGLTQRIEGGDLTARLPRPHGSGELGQLERAFDEMAAALEERQVERDRAKEQLLRDAFHDRLTGLPNRALFADRLGVVIDRAARGPEHGFVVLTLDLDRLSVVNDSMGHGVGDELLVAVAQRLEACTRPGDTAARLGADEFALLLEDVPAGDGPRSMATAVRDALAQPFALSGGDVFATASVGIVVSSAERETAEQYLRDADTAMNRAKALGGDRAEVFDARMRAAAVERLRLDTDLRRAIEREEFRLVYQPVASLATGRIVAAEALLRWDRGERGTVAPVDFIPLAEETGLIAAIGEFGLRTACIQAKKWMDAGIAEARMAVNVSALQVREGDLPAMVRRVLDDTGLPARLLELEITESTIMDNAEENVRVLTELHDLGIKLSVDDFGTGYSSLRYLQRFPVQRLKVDQYFVKATTRHASDAAIVSAIIALGHRLDLLVVAEGVETFAQLAFLRAEGCDEVQGQFLSPPVDAERLTLLLLDDKPIVPATDGASVEG